MNASLVRLGGAAAFAAIVIAMIGAIVPGTADASIVLSALQTALILFAFWATKVLFNGRNYRRANVPIVGTIVLVLLIWLSVELGFHLLGNRSDAQPASSALNMLRLAVLIVSLLFLAFLLWFAVRATNFGSEAVGGGSIWIAIGALYIAAVALLVIIAVALVVLEARGTSAAVPMTATGLVGRIYMVGFVTAVLLCHGIGLLIGAGRLRKAD